MFSNIFFLELYSTSRTLLFNSVSMALFVMVIYCSLPYYGTLMSIVVRYYLTVKATLEL